MGVTVGEVIAHLQKYNPDVPFVVHIASMINDIKADQTFMIGAPVDDDEAWYDDLEMTSKASSVELLIFNPAGNE